MSVHRYGSVRSSQEKAFLASFATRKRLAVLAGKLRAGKITPQEALLDLERRVKSGIVSGKDFEDEVQVIVRASPPSISPTPMVRVAVGCSVCGDPSDHDGDGHPYEGGEDFEEMQERRRLALLKNPVKRVIG